MKIRTIIGFCMASLMAMGLTSCDKDANNVKMVTVSGTYDGDIIAELYMPDFEVEYTNAYLNENGLASVAADTIRGGEVELHFASDDNAYFGLNHLSGMDFNIHFAFVSEKDDIAVVNGIYEGGLFAKFFSIVRNHYMKGDMAKEDFFRFAKMMEYIGDTINLNNFSVQPFKMRERGAMYSTFDYKQNSVYVRTAINTFMYSRKTNMTAALAFAENKLATLMSSEEQTVFNALKNGIKSEDTVNGASAWTTMAYSNYKPFLDVTIDSAPGLLDVLTKALFGDYKLNGDGEILKDAQGTPVPTRSLVINVVYEGTISNMSSFERIEN